MPFERFMLDLTCFLSLITFLASHPTEPYYESWQGRTESFRITQRSFHPESLRRKDPGIEGGISPISTPVDITRRGDESDQLAWYQANERNPPRPQYDGRPGHPVYPRRDFEQSSPSYFNYRSATAEGVTDSPSGAGCAGGITDYGLGNYNGNYSSHVHYRVDDQYSGATDITGRLSGDHRNEEVFGLGRRSDEEERINFEENFRNYRRGNTRKGSTNTISTEKPVRNHTQKGVKRQRPGSPSKSQGSQIVFPDGGYRRQKFTPRGSKCGKKTTFCEHVGDEYPSEYINQILNREGAMFREFFGEDVIRDPNISERIHAPEENSLCPFRQEVVFPRAAKNKEDKWLFVVNQDKYVQGVTVEVCLNPESRCILTEGFPLGYTPYCKQKYIERRLVAIGEDGKPHSDSFRLPSCCSCVVKHETSARMASFQTPRNTSPAPSKEGLQVET